MSIHSISFLTLSMSYNVCYTYDMILYHTIHPIHHLTECMHAYKYYKIIQRGTILFYMSSIWSTMIPYCVIVSTHRPMECVRKSTLLVTGIPTPIPGTTRDTPFPPLPLFSVASGGGGICWGTLPSWGPFAASPKRKLRRKERHCGAARGWLSDYGPLGRPPSRGSGRGERGVRRYLKGWWCEGRGKGVRWRHVE